jgi:outer membrane lipoprotein SlyB
MKKIYHTKTGQPYIILPNGRALFIKKSRSIISLYSKRKSRGVRMARRRYHRRNSGIFSGSLLKKIALGAVAGFAVAQFSPVKGIIPQAGAGYLVGGTVGAVAGAVAPQMLSKTSTNTSMLYQA